MLKYLQKIIPLLQILLPSRLFLNKKRLFSNLFKLYNILRYWNMEKNQTIPLPITSIKILMYFFTFYINIYAIYMQV